jgi:hypothetical protein
MLTALIIQLYQELKELERKGHIVRESLEAQFEDLDRDG